ncbi:MAG: sigma-70 family RNA polymerase sigma factor [Micrococcaceae bacterium]
MSGTVDERLRELVAQCAAGDQDAFRALYADVAPVVFGVALRVLRDRSLAEETAQEVLLAVWSSASRFDPARGSVLGWASTMSHRRAVDVVRSVQAQRRRDQAEGARSAVPVAAGVEETVLMSDDAAAVRHCLEALSEPERDAVQLAYFQGRSYREVAQESGTPEGTVKSRIRTALKRLATCLGVRR